MVGGGQGAFIGGVHRMAARLDDRYELVAGALSSDAARAAASAAELHIAPERSYADYARHGARARPRAPTASTSSPSSRRTTCTRRIATAFLDAGIDVICDKPLTTTLAEALDAGRSACARSGTPVRADAQLQRLSDGAPGARDGRRRRARRDPRRAGRIPAGLAQHRPRSDRPEAGRMARRPGTGRRGRLARRHRHPCRAPGALHLRASNWRPSAPT